MSEMWSPERRVRYPSPYRLPDSPYPLPQIPFRKTVALTSPRRAEPILINISVDPKPIRDTGNGEHFACDISIDVQSGGSAFTPQTARAVGGEIEFDPDMSPESDRTFVDEMFNSPGSSDRTLTGEMFDSPRSEQYHQYGSELPHHSPPPPPVRRPERITPRILTRRRRMASRYNAPVPSGTDLYTPKGPQRDVWERRRLLGRGPISEMSRSPAYLPENARPPVTSPATSDPRWSSRSVPWESTPPPDAPRAPKQLSPWKIRRLQRYQPPPSFQPQIGRRYQSPEVQYESPDFDDSVDYSPGTS